MKVYLGYRITTLLIRVPCSEGKLSKKTKNGRNAEFVPTLLGETGNPDWEELSNRLCS
jgi:hypothetical protein